MVRYSRRCLAALAVVVLLIVAAPRTRADWPSGECGPYYENLIAWAIGMRDTYNNALAYDQLFLAEDLASGADQGTINADLAQIEYHAGMADQYQAFADGWNTALGSCYN